MKDINRKIGIGVLWNFAGLFMTRGASTLFTIFLARVLAPEIFGLIAMATVVFELSNALINSGLSQALIRSKSVTKADLNTVFITNLALSGLVYVTLFFGAPFVAEFYSQPELTGLIRVVGLIVFINATKVVQTAILSREMNFKAQMKANTTGVVISGALAIYMAYTGWGIWSLAAQMLSSALVSAIVLWLASSWRPALQFSLESLARLFRFGKNLLVEGFLQILFDNSYVLVIGRFFSAELTGLYFFAQKISQLVSRQLTFAVQQATFPALSTLQDDNAALRTKYSQILQVMMLMIAPVMALLAALAAPLFNLLFDEQWQAAVPYLQLLCVVGAIYPLHALNVNLLNVKGRSDLVLKVGLLKKAVSLSLLFLAIPYGVEGIVVGQIIGSSLALIPNTYFSKKLVDYSLAAQLLDAAKPILVATVAGGVALGVSSLILAHPLLSLLCGGFAGVTMGLVLSIALKIQGINYVVSRVKFLQPINRFL